MSAPPNIDAHLAALRALITSWVDSKRSSTALLNTNVMTVGMTVSNRLGEAFPIEDSAIRTARDQVKGLSGESVSRTLRKFGEIRPFTSEDLQRQYGLGVCIDRPAKRSRPSLSAAERVQLADDLQEWFVRLIQREYFDKKRKIGRAHV